MQKRVPIIAVIAIIVIAIGFGGLIVVQRRHEEQQTAHIQALQEEAAPYEDEISAIQADLENHEKAFYSEEQPVANAVICFAPTSADDLDVVKKLTENYDLTPAILLNCSQSTSALQQYLWRITYEKYDILLTSDTFDETVLKTADEICELLPAYMYTKQPAFLLKDTLDTDTNRKLLSEHGYKNMFRYSESLESGSDGDTLYLPYKFIDTTIEYDSFADAVVNTHGGAALVFDLQEMKNGKFAETDVTDFLNVLNSRKSEEKLNYVDFTAAFTALQESEGKVQQYNSYKTEQEARLKSLQTQVREIYGHWNDYQ